MDDRGPAWIPRPAIWMPWLAAAIVAVYWVGLTGPYFADDFQFYLASGHSNPLRFFHSRIPDNNFYRPLQAALMAATQAIWGLNPIPIHLVALLLHTLLSGLVFVAMMRLGFRPLQAVLGAGYMAICQANVFAVLSVDTLSQIGSTLCACLALWWTFRGALDGRPADVKDGGLRRGPYLAGLVCFALSLLGKETGASVIVPIGLLLVVGSRPSGGWSSALVRGCVRAVPHFLVLVAYFLIRSTVAGAAASLGTERYDFQLGVGLFLNIGLLLFATLVPVSSVGVFRAFDRGDHATLALIALATLFVAAMCLWGLIQSNRKPALAWVSVFALLAFFPAAALNHVSELYAYNALPCISILMGAGLGGLLESQRGLRAVAASCLLGVLFLSHVVAVQDKGHLMTRNGTRAMDLISQVRPWLGEIRQGGQLVLVSPPVARRGQYAVFLMDGFEVLGEGPHGLARAMGREDIQVKFTKADSATLAPGEGVMLTLERGRIVPYLRDPSFLTGSEAVR